MFDAFQDCTVIYSEKMECPTPKLDINPTILNAVNSGGRTKRDISHAENIISSLHPINSIVKSQTIAKITHLLDRHRRAADSVDNQLNKTQKLDFYIGFRLDGVTTYTNLSQTLRDKGTITVYIDPVVHKFDDDEHVRDFKPYWPFHDNFIGIEVSQL